MDEKFLYDTFNMHYKNGMSAKTRGDFRNAKRNLLLAAETLFKLAKETKGELKTARFDRAERLVQMANCLDADVAYAPRSVQSPKGSPSSIGKKKESNDGKNSEEDSTLTEWEAAKIPDICFDDVAGLDNVKESVKRRIILPLNHAETYKKYNKKVGGGIMLYGLPGTGKTMVAKAIANEVGAKFYSVKCSDIVSKWFGEAEKNIKNLFDTARKEERAIIFFDEFEALGSKRGGDSSVMNRIVPELLAQIQGFTESDSMLLLLAATNRPWDIDSALLRPGRFNELLYVPLPDFEARKYMINKALKGLPLEGVNIDYISEATDGFNGSDVTEFCDRLKDNPLYRDIASGVKDSSKLQSITLEDVTETLKDVKSSVQKGDIKALEEFMQGRV